MELTGFSAESRFSPIFSGDALSHAYVISGPAGAGKEALAETLAAAAVCSSGGKRPCGECAHCKKTFRGIHPDVAYIRPADDKRDITVEQIRALRSDAQIMPNEANRKVYIIEKAGSLNPNAQNAMLKLLEEPPSSVMLILIAENTSELLQTVRSRCVELALVPPEESVRNSMDSAAGELMAAASKGSFEAAMYIFGLEKLSKDEFTELIAAAGAMCISELKRLESGEGSAFTASELSRMVSVFSTASDYLRANVNIGHIAGYICASLCEG